MSDLVENRQIRVFISSTFLDMMDERDYLVKKVFPSLRSYCEKRDITFFELDLRWGITEEESKQGRVVETCLNEIKNTRPFFIGLLGERYGWVPNRNEQELIGQNTNVLSDYPWVKDELNKGTSITEIEIQEGVLLAKEKVNAYFYFRSPEVELPPEYKEEDGSEASNKLAKLKSKIREQYPIKNFSSKEELGELVEKDFKDLVSRIFPSGWISELEKERLEQRSCFKRLTLVYIPRDIPEDAVDSFINSNERALVITGGNGMGKSAFLANWIQKNDKKSQGPKILYHFIGVTKLGGNFRKIRQRLISEVRKIFGIVLNIERRPAGKSALEQELSIDEKKKNELRDYLFSIPKNENLVIVLDGINKLTDVDGAKLLNWLPEYPENVRFIFSTPKDDPVMDVFKRMNYPVITIPALDIESRKGLIKDYLLSFGKKLTPFQTDRIANDEESANPMILRALLDELRFFGVFEKLDEEIDRYLAAKSIPDFYIKVLERLEKIFDYTDTAASNFSMDILSLLYVSRNGLSEAEIASLGGAKPLYWSQLYNAVKGNLIVCGGLINFSHNYIREAIKCRYFAKKDNENSYRLWLIHYFKTNPNVSKKRTYHELPYQFFNIGDLSGLYRFLMNYDVLEYWVKTDIVEFGKYWRVLRETDKKKYPIEKYLELNVKKMDKDSLCTLYSFLGMFIGFLGDDNAMALKFTQDALTLREEILGKEHEDTLTDYNNLGQMHFAMGDHQKALEYYQRALDIRRKTGGGNNSDTAVSYNNMGQVYYTMGNCQKALEYHQLALGIQKELCGEKDIDTATSYNNIGLIYSSMGNTQKALYYAQHALDIQKEILGEKHINTATSYNNIGEINTLMGNYQNALEYYQRALSIKEEILGKEHPQSVLIRKNLIGIHIILAAAYYKKGDNNAAMTSIKEAADLGCEDPAALVAKCKLPLPGSTP